MAQTELHYLRKARLMAQTSKTWKELCRKAGLSESTLRKYGIHPMRGIKHKNVTAVIPSIDLKNQGVANTHDSRFSVAESDGLAHLNYSEKQTNPITSELQALIADAESVLSDPNSTNADVTSVAADRELPESVRAKACAHSAVDAEALLLDKYSVYSETLWMELAANSATPPNVLSVFVAGEYGIGTACKAAENPHLARSDMRRVLERACSEGEYSEAGIVLASVAKNPSLSYGLAGEIVDNKLVAAMGMLVQNERVPSLILERIKSEAVNTSLYLQACRALEKRTA